MSSNVASPPPTANSLHQAALSYLARYAATETVLRRTLMRQIDRWARTQADPEAAAPTITAARQSIDGIISRLVAAGAVSDTVFAENRAKTLVRGGQSNRAIQARLIAKGVAPDLARSTAASDADTELAAALVLVRKRRIGAYRSTDNVDATARMKELALLARAGFSRDIAKQALETSREEAETRIFDLRQ